MIPNLLGNIPNWNKIKLIASKFIANKPLNPSIKLEPLITNKKQNKTNKIKKYSFFIQIFRKIKSTLSISIEKKPIHADKINIIEINRIIGFILIFKSSKKPTKNSPNPIIKYS